MGALQLAVKAYAQAEMCAYDSLPKVVRAVFANAPQGVSVRSMFKLPGVVKAYKEHPPERFAMILENHFVAMARDTHTNSP